MKDYLDFIDSRSLREDLRLWRTLPPAMQCIVVSQSGCRSLADKLAALREILAATPPGDFADGEYQLACNDLDFAAALDRHIRRKEERLAAFLAPAPDAVYVPHDPRNGYDIAAFATFAECLESVRDIGADNDGQILVVLLERRGLRARSRRAGRPGRASPNGAPTGDTAQEMAPSIFRANRRKCNNLFATIQQRKILLGHFPL